MANVGNPSPKAQRLIDVTLADLESLIEQAVQRTLERMPQQEQADELLTVEQAAEFLSLHKTTIYGLVSKGELPHMKRSKRVYFSKQELIAYLKAGRKSTQQELRVKAEEYLPKKKGGYHG